MRTTAEQMIDEATDFGGIAQTKADLASLMERYAQQERAAAVKLALEMASEKVKATSNLGIVIIDKTSILSLEQEILNKLKK